MGLSGFSPVLLQVTGLKSEEQSWLVKTSHHIGFRNNCRKWDIFYSVSKKNEPPIRFVYVRLFAIANPSVCRLLSVTFVNPTQPVEIFCNISTRFCILQPSADLHDKLRVDQHWASTHPDLFELLLPYFIRFHETVWQMFNFYQNVITLRLGICYRKSVCLSSVTFVLPTQPLKFSAMFLRHFVYARHPLASVQNFTEIVSWEPLRLGLNARANIATLDMSKAISRKWCKIRPRVRLMC